MARKEKDRLIGDDHQYASRLYSYLTPPSTPRLESFVDDDESDYFVKESTLDDTFDLYSTTCFADSEENDPFYDFAEDFRDLRLPMLKSDCMWGTAEQIRSSRVSPDSSSTSVTRCSSRNFAATPLQLTFRSTTTTPISFDDRNSMNLFVPITSTISLKEIENVPKDAVTPSKVSTSLATTRNLPLLSPNETESEDEIDVVGIPERQKTHTTNSATMVSERKHHKASDKTKKLASKVDSSSSASATPSPNSSDSDDSPSGRSRNVGSAPGRVSHNDLERKRRDELKRKFDCLRAVIPEIENNERAPKVVILKKAKAFVPRLQEEEKVLRTEKENLKRVNSLLMKKLLLLTKRN